MKSTVITLINFNLYGHLFEDEIYYLKGFPEENRSNICESFEKRLGGTDNFFRRFKKISSSNIKRVELNSRAIVIINNTTGSRTSIVKWPNEELSDDFPNCDWAHFMYLDNLNVDVELFKNIKRQGGLISADMCMASHDDANKQRLSGLLKYVDYLIISDVEYDDIKSECSLCKNLVVHSPKSIMYNGDILENPEYASSVKNTLGAGDFFCAEFINSIINGDSITTACEVAAKKSSLYVKGELNEEI
jgi:sugar/nucleoside kinase (ribokinase family)